LNEKEKKGIQLVSDATMKRIENHVRTGEKIHIPYPKRLLDENHI